MKRFTLLLLLAFVSATTMANDYRYTKSRSVDRNFKVTSNSNIALDVKYANVDVVLWDKKEIAVRAELKVEASNQNTVDAVMERIKIEMNQTGNSVSVRNFMDSYKNDNLKNYSMKIIYTISLPRDTKMDIINKYGNINLPAINRPLTVEHKYGNLKISDMVAAASQINIKYGNIDIMGAKAKLNIITKYGNVKLGTVADVAIESGYCKFRAEGVQSLSGYTKYDNYKIGQLGSISLTGAGYGDFTIDNLKESMELNGLKYSHLRVNNVQSSFKFINIPDAGYTDILLTIPSGSFKANTSVKYGKTKIYDMVSDGTLVTNVGGSNPSSSISIVNRYGDITIVK